MERGAAAAASSVEVASVASCGPAAACLDAIVVEKFLRRGAFGNIDWRPRAEALRKHVLQIIVCVLFVWSWRGDCSGWIVVGAWCAGSASSKNFSAGNLGKAHDGMGDAARRRETNNPGDGLQ